MPRGVDVTRVVTLVTEVDVRDGERAGRLVHLEARVCNLRRGESGGVLHTAGQGEVHSLLLTLSQRIVESIIYISYISYKSQ